MLFDPNASKAEKAAKNKVLKDLKVWGTALIAEGELREGLILDINEVVCGDPTCAPIDTVFTLIWEAGGKGVFAIPLAPNEIEKHELPDFFPDEETLRLWKKGKKARWPKLPELRFSIGDRVECRIGPHPVKGWAPGRIVKLYYTEENWPPNMVAPYQIALHDGRLIFAPQDREQVIRLRPPPAPDAPSSPDYIAQEDDEGMNEDDDEEYDEEEEEEEEEEGEVGTGQHGSAWGNVDDIKHQR
jgi:hypothetical protein